MNKPTVKEARRVCDALDARQVVVVAFDGEGAFGVASYGETRGECKLAAKTCDAIADMLMDGRLPVPVE